MESLGAEEMRSLGGTSWIPQHCPIKLPQICSHSTLLAPTVSIAGSATTLLVLPVAQHKSCAVMDEYLRSPPAESVYLVSRLYKFINLSKSTSRRTYLLPNIKYGYAFLPNANTGRKAFPAKLAQSLVKLETVLPNIHRDCQTLCPYSIVQHSTRVQHSAVLSYRRLPHLLYRYSTPSIPRLRSKFVGIKYRSTTKLTSDPENLQYSD